MTDIVPLLLGEPTELETMLLSSAEDDEPAADALVRVGTALGVSAAALAGVSVGGSALVGQAAVAGNAVALSKPLTLLSLTKWLAVGIGAGMATGGVAQVASRAIEPQPPAFVASTPVAAPLQAATPSAPRGDSATASPTPAPETEASASPANTATFAPPSAAPAAEPASTAAPAHTGFASFDTPEAKPGAESPASTLGEETKALDGARQALATGRARDGLGALDAYRAKWPQGALRAEAALLRVDALLRLGNRPAAEREANVLISAAPSSRYATRARALLADKRE